MLCCERTGKECGTDTYQKGHHCQCGTCKDWSQTLESGAWSKAWEIKQELEKIHASALRTQDVKSVVFELTGLIEALGKCHPPSTD